MASTAMVLKTTELDNTTGEYADSMSAPFNRLLTLIEQQPAGSLALPSSLFDLLLVMPESE